jgi:two-component system sensor histidine kinase CpxA
MNLSRKVALLVLLNLAAITLLLVVFLKAQFGLDPETLLAGPVRERVLATGVQLSRDIEGARASEREEILKRYERDLQVELFLITPRGEPLDGKAVQIPREVLNRMHAGRPLMEGEPESGVPPPPPPPPEDRPREDRGKKGKKGAGRPAETMFSLLAGDPPAYWIGARIPVRSWDEGFQPGVLLFRTGSLFRGPLFLDLRMWLGFAAAVLIVSLLCWLPFIQGVATAVARMRQAAERIAQGQFQVHAAQQRSDEIGDLSRQIDTLAGRLEGFVKGQKRFLGDIAHELSAPIARVQFALAILEQRADASLQPSVQQLHEEVQDMSQLVNELLSFSKAGMASDPSKVELAVHELLPVVERAAAREAGGKAEVRIDVSPDIHVLAHEAFLSRALGNVVRNAVRHAGAAGPIEIRAWQSRDRVFLTVADSGPGLPAYALQSVFMPFYRPDDSRDRQLGGGAGLGLAIVKDCVEACRGTIVCRNRKDRSGLEVEFSLLAARNE